MKQINDISIDDFAEMAKDFEGDDFQKLDPLEVMSHLFGEDKPREVEKNAARIMGEDFVKRSAERMRVTPLQWIRTLQNGSEPPTFSHKLAPKTMTIIQKAKEFISQYDMPLTVRQVYYRFVGEQLIENSLKSYKRIANILAQARELGFIKYDKIVDRTRQVIKPSSWSSPKDFFNTVTKAYNKTMLSDQDNYIEVWVEKDALAGVFEPITAQYDINLVSGRGYPSHSALYESAKRVNKDKTIKYLYFGDFDPSGEDIFRDIQRRLNDLFHVYADFEKVALTLEDIQTYKLPPAPAKRSDSRASAFIKKNGDLSVELDALPPDVLAQKIRMAIERNIDIEKYNAQLELQKKDREKIEEIVSKFT